MHKTNQLVGQSHLEKPFCCWRGRRVMLFWASPAAKKAVLHIKVVYMTLLHASYAFTQRIVLSRRYGGQLLVPVFGTYAGKLSFFPFSTFVTYK